MPVGVYDVDDVAEVDGERGYPLIGLYSEETGWVKDERSFEELVSDATDEELLQRYKPPGKTAVKYDTVEDAPAVAGNPPEDWTS